MLGHSRGDRGLDELLFVDEVLLAQREGLAQMSAGAAPGGAARLRGPDADERVAERRAQSLVHRAVEVESGRSERVRSVFVIGGLLTGALGAPCRERASYPSSV